jgi:FkbM family methyltransferase
MNSLKRFTKKILSYFIKGYKLPRGDGFISVYDEIGAKKINFFWRRDSFMETRLYQYGLYGNWEKTSLRVWALLSKESKTILDIGANTGIYSLIARSNNNLAKIIAVEPIEINYQVLQKNIEANAFNIIAEKIAISDYDGNAKMYMLKDRLNYMTSVNDNRYELHPEVSKGSEVIEVNIDVRIYSFLKHKYKVDRLDLIKIDVEGHEVNVLKSLIIDIKLSRPAILIEIIGDDNALEINELLSGLEYKFFSIDEEAGRVVCVKKLWDNDHQNFLICTQNHIDYLNSSKFLIG